MSEQPLSNVILLWVLTFKSLRRTINHHRANSPKLKCVISAPQCQWNQKNYVFKQVSSGFRCSEVCNVFLKSADHLQNKNTHFISKKKLQHGPLNNL